MTGIAVLILWLGFGKYIVKKEDPVGWENCSFWSKTIVCVVTPVVYLADGIDT